MSKSVAMTVVTVVFGFAHWKEWITETCNICMNVLHINWLIHWIIFLFQPLSWIEYYTTYLSFSQYTKRQMVTRLMNSKATHPPFVYFYILVKMANYPLLHWWMNSSKLRDMQLRKNDIGVSDIKLVVINFGLTNIVYYVKFRFNNGPYNYVISYCMFSRSIFIGFWLRIAKYATSDKTGPGPSMIGYCTFSFTC